MNALELTKSQKKIARRIIDTGIQREYEAGIKKLDRIISRWKREEIEDACQVISNFCNFDPI